MYVAFARSLMTSVDAPTVPAPDEVVNGSARRQHSSAELPSCVTIAVNSRYVPFAEPEVRDSGSAKAEVVASQTTSDTTMLRKCILQVAKALNVGRSNAEQPSPRLDKVHL